MLETVLHRRRGQPNPRVEPKLNEPMDLDQGFAEALRKDPPMRRPPEEFAPNPARAAERAIETIEEFGALPLKQIDEQLTALRAEMAGAEKLGQTIRDMIMQIRQDYLDKLERSHKVAKLTQASFAKLAEEFAAIDAQPAAEDTTAEKTEEEPIANEQPQPAAT